MFTFHLEDDGTLDTLIRVRDGQTGKTVTWLRYDMGMTLDYRSPDGTLDEEAFIAGVVKPHMDFRMKHRTHDGLHPHDRGGC